MSPRLLCLFLAGVYTCWAVPDATNAPPVLIEEDEGALSFDFGAYNRTREEATKNIPGNTGGGPDVSKRIARVKGVHLMRFETYAWARADAGPFTLYGRLGNRIIEHFRSNGTRRDDRLWKAPDEIILDNLYLNATGLADGLWDFRIGRQDLAEGGHSIFGLDRLVTDGTPSDFGRSSFSDMARIALHPDADSKLDIFGLYDSDENPLAWGRQCVHERSLNYLTTGNDGGPDQWGGGLVWHAQAFRRELPYKVYLMHKRDTAYHRGAVHVPEKQLTTIGTLWQPQLTETFSLELEGAGQTGERESWGAAGGWMGVAGVNYHPKLITDIKTYGKFDLICYSGDKDRSDGHGDKAWDPMWARYTDYSEIFVRGVHAQSAYWSNMIFARTTLGANFGPHHGVQASSGPVWSAVDDGIGGGDGTFKGVLSRMRYDFPLRLRPPKAQGFKRFEVFGHFLIEYFSPGDYYESTRPALYARWQLEFRF